MLLCGLERDGTIRFMNQAYASIFGARASDLQGGSLWPLVSAEERYRIERSFALLKPEAPSHSAEGPIAGRMDSARFQWICTGLAFDDQDRCCLLHMTGLDITDRRQGQAALIMQRLDEIADGAGLGTWEWNVDTGELRINARWAAMLGFSIEELGALSIETCAGLRHPDDLAEANRLAERHIAGETPYFEVEARMRHKNGNWVWVRDRGRVIARGPDGRPTLMFGTHLDITATKEASQRLKDLTDRLRDAVDVAGLRLWKVDIATGQLSWDSETSQSSKPSQLRNTMPALDAIAAIHAEDRPTFEAAARKAIFEGLPMTTCVRVVGATGTVSHVEYRAHLSNDSRQLIGISRDITADVKARDELIRKRREAEAASLAKSAFVAKMSHEIRTPMNGVIGMLEVMRRMDLSPEAREHVETALSSAGDLRHILDDVLDVSQLEAKKVSINRATFEVRTLIESSVALFASRASQKNTVLSAFVDPGVPRWLLGDRRRIRQVLNNLIGNAVKFTEEGSISVSASYDTARDLLRMVVSDTGIGMPDAVSARAFEPFFQAEETATRRFGGSGLGLAICKQLVEIMGGEISVSSAPGRGSEFTFTLPMATATEPEHSDAEPATEVATRPLRVLVVEDNVANQKILRALLSSVGHAVAIAENGSDAIAMAASDHFDLILMDIMMPVMDGVTATRHIRELGGRAGGVPIVALTANAFADDRLRYLEAGMTDYLAKPIDARALLGVIARAAAAAE